MRGAGDGLRGGDRRQGPDADRHRERDLARHHEGEKLRHRRRAREVRGGAGAGGGRARPLGGRFRQHPRGAGHRRGDGQEAAAGVRLAGRAAGPGRRGEGEDRRAAGGVRRPGEALPHPGHHRLRRADRLQLPGLRRLSAGQPAAGRALQGVRLHHLDEGPDQFPDALLRQVPPGAGGDRAARPGGRAGRRPRLRLRPGEHQPQPA